jgi:hypothetical protein
MLSMSERIVLSRSISLLLGTWDNEAELGMSKEHAEEIVNNLELRQGQGLSNQLKSYQGKQNDNNTFWRTLYDEA